MHVIFRVVKRESKTSGVYNWEEQNISIDRGPLINLFNVKLTFVAFENTV